MIGIFWNGYACEYVGRFTMVGDVRMYEYRAQEGKAIENKIVFSERAPESIYVPPKFVVNTFRDSGL